MEMRPPQPGTELAVPENSQLATAEGEFPAHSSWSVGRTAFVTVLLLAMVGVSVYRVMSSKLSAPATERAETRPPETAIDLQVERRPDGQLDLNWNRDFARIAGRDGARLSITDGPYVRTLELTEDQLLSGKLAYFPRSDDIRFHLEMSVGRDRTIGESIRVVSPEVYASSLPAARSHPNPAERASTAIPVSLTEQNGAADLRAEATGTPPPLNAGAGIVRTDTPGKLHSGFAARRARHGGG